MRSLLCPVVVLLVGCLVDFPPLPADGLRPETSLDGPLMDRDGPDGPPKPDGPPTDAPPPVDGLVAPDKNATCLGGWSPWSCAQNPANCVSTCSNYKLVCNQTQCTCTDGVTINTCGSSTATTCSDCQAAFNAGCCQGL